MCSVAILSDVCQPAGTWIRTFYYVAGFWGALLEEEIVTLWVLVVTTAVQHVIWPNLVQVGLDTGVRLEALYIWKGKELHGHGLDVPILDGKAVVMHNYMDHIESHGELHVAIGLVGSLPDASLLS